MHLYWCRTNTFDESHYERVNFDIFDVAETIFRTYLTWNRAKSHNEQTSFKIEASFPVSLESSENNTMLSCENNSKGATRKKREMVSRSCRSCRLAKKKCDTQRPCGRCLRKQLDETCKDWDPDEKDDSSYIQMGVANSSVQLDTLVSRHYRPQKPGQNPFIDSIYSQGWNQSTLIRLWEIGFSEDQLVIISAVSIIFHIPFTTYRQVRIFTSMPSELSDVLKTGFSSLDTISNEFMASEKVVFLL